MAELSLINNPEVHNYSGSREMPAERKLKIQFTGADVAAETVLEETCPEGETWTVKVYVVKIINND